MDGDASLAALREQAHVWLAFPDRISAPDLLEKYWGLLCDEERQRQQRFRFQRDRHLYLVAHALVRTTLSRYLPVAPWQWRFSQNRYGRPEIAVPRAEAGLRFNLSHTHGLVACVATAAIDCGVDVEQTERIEDLMSLATSVFSGREVENLRARPAARQRRRFFQFWTLKEAYIKACGMGLALPLDQFSFLLDRPGVIDVAFAPGFEDRPQDWQFAQSQPSPRHLLAVALRREGAPDRAVVTRTVVPCAPGG